MTPPNRRAERRHRGRRHDQRGSGILGTTFGVAVFLLLLTFASHLLVGLWQTSSVEAIARDAALEVATSASTAEPSLAEARALQRAQVALGGLARDVELRFEPDPGGRDVVLHVRAPKLRLVPGVVAGVVGDDGLDRRIVVPKEVP